MSRPRKRKPVESKGLGDTIAKVTKATGIDKLVKFLAGEDCGCDERKDFLNKLFPYNKPNCLNETEYNYLTETIPRIKELNAIKPSEQGKLLIIYDRIFNTKTELTQCESCWRKIMSDFDSLMKTYEDEQ